MLHTNFVINRILFLCKCFGKYIFYVSPLKQLKYIYIFNLSLCFNGKCNLKGAKINADPRRFVALKKIDIIHQINCVDL